MTIDGNITATDFGEPGDDACAVEVWSPVLKEDRWLVIDQ